MFGEVNESVKAYGIGGHRHVAEIEQELADRGAWREGLDPSANPGAIGVDFLPHLIPMTRGILSTCHVRPTRPITQAELDELYADAYADEPFVTVVATPPATKHVTGSNEVRCPRPLDERTGRILVIGVEDNLVKGAAGQAIQAFNLVHGLPETAGPRTAAAGPVTRLDDRHASEPRPPDSRPGVARPSSRRSSDAPRCLPAFEAGGLAAGIKASGRPDLAVVVTTLGSGRRGRRLHPERVRGRAGPPVEGAPRGHVRATRAAGSAGPRRSSRPAAAPTPRPARRATPTSARSRGSCAEADRRGRRSGRSTSRPGSSARDCRSTRSAAGLERARADARGDRRRAEADGRGAADDRLGDEGRDDDRRAARRRRRGP